MRRLIYLLAFVSIIFAQAKAQQRVEKCKKDSVVYRKLMKMDFNKYKNMTVQTFFDDLGYTYQKYLFEYVKPGFIGSVIMVYSDSLTVNIAVKNLGQKEPRNFNYKFDMDVFKSKKINWLYLKYAGECIKGCKEENCE